MKNFIIKETKNKGLGVFTSKNSKKGSHIFHINLTKLKKYSLNEIEENPNLDGDHSSYVGHGKYIMDYSSPSYLNHSCDPNCYIKMKTIALRDVYALRDIKRGEELTVDYTATSVDQFAGMGFWREKCRCGSRKCRKILQGDFFKLSRSLQKKYYSNLPPSIKRKYKRRFEKLRFTVT